jgi:flavorubredoxin
MMHQLPKKLAGFGSLLSGSGAEVMAAAIPKLNLFGDGFKVIFVPTEEDLAKARELGEAFAKTL